MADLPEQQSPAGVPYQMDVYFSDFPSIDSAALAKFLNDSDPGEEPCTVEHVRSEQGGPVRLDSYMASLGDFSMMILIHSVPSPAADLIQSSRLPDEAKNTLAQHKAFALLQNHGGEQYTPCENIIFLYKVATGLCAQGALGCAHLHVGIVLPADLLLSLHEMPREETDEEGKPLTLWRTIREDAEPQPILINLCVAKGSDGADWLVSRGFAFCGFPDWIYKITAGEKIDDVVEMFRSGFPYLMQNGPVIQAGHTMGHDEKVAFRFAAPPGDLQFPFPTYGMLQVFKETKPRKKWLGLF